MSTGLAHFAVGGILTALVVTIVLPDVRYPRLIVTLGGVWGIVPDGWRITPINRNAFEAFHASPWADLFWFHYTLDRLDPADSLWIGLGAAVGFLLVTILAEHRGFRRIRPRAGSVSGE